jgi:hypothetical protein
MKTWKTHVSWAGVTIVVAAAWGHHVSTEAGLNPQRDRAGVQEGLGASRMNSSPKGESRVAGPDQPQIRLAQTPTEPMGAPFVSTPKDELSSDQMRAMLRRRSQWGQAFEVLKRLEDRPRKLTLLGELFTLGSVDLRIPTSAYMQLAEMGGPDAAEVIEKGLLIADDDRMRIRAVKALGQAGASRSVGVLLETYQSAALELRVACAAALNELGNAGPASEVLLTLGGLLDNPDGAIRREAVENISTLKVSTAIPVLAQALRDSNGDVRSEAISGLEGLGLPGVMPLLEQATNDSNSSVANDARNAIERLRKPKDRRNP